MMAILGSNAERWVREESPGLGEAQRRTFYALRPDRHLLKMTWVQMITPTLLARPIVTTGWMALRRVNKRDHLALCEDLEQRGFTKIPNSP
jgi:hypothetical protein